MSKDGLLLAAIPDDDDTQRAWSRFVSIGLPTRGAVEFKDASWIQCSDDRIMVFALTGPQVRAGIVMSRLDQELGSMDHSPVMAGPASAAPSLAPTAVSPPPAPVPDPLPGPLDEEADEASDRGEDEEEKVDFALLQSEFAGLHDLVEPEPPAPEPRENPDVRESPKGF